MLAFALGALAFFAGDWIIDRRGGADRKNIPGNQPGGSGAAIFIGTLLDNVPESIILGMSIKTGGAINLAFLTAVFISNLPEGVAGSINLQTAGTSRQKIFWMWVTLVLVSAICAGIGYIAIQVLPGANGVYAQAFAAGAMLTMLADAMMPEAFRARRYPRWAVYRARIYTVCNAIGDTGLALMSDAAQGCEYRKHGANPLQQRSNKIFDDTNQRRQKWRRTRRRHNKGKKKQEKATDARNEYCARHLLRKAHRKQRQAPTAHQKDRDPK